MSESSIPTETKAALSEVEAILKEPKLLAKAKQVLEDHKTGLLEAFKKSPSSADKDLAVCIATARTLAEQMPDVANRLQIFQLISRKNDPHEGSIIPKIHNVLGFADDKGQPVEIIDPGYFLVQKSTPFLVGPKAEVLPQYTEPGDPHQVIPVKIEKEDIIDFMDNRSNNLAVSTFEQALKTAA